MSHTMPSLQASDNEKIALESEGAAGVLNGDGDGDEDGAGDGNDSEVSDGSFTNPTRINEKSLLRKLDRKLLPALSLLYLLSFLDRSNSMLSSIFFD